MGVCYTRATFARPIGCVYVFFVFTSLDLEIKRRKNTVEMLNLGVGCFVLANTKRLKQTTDMQRQICFIVFGFIQLLEPQFASVGPVLQEAYGLQICCMCR